MLLDQENDLQDARAAAWKKLEAEKSFTERVVAVVEFPWYFAEIQCKGKGTRKQAFEMFDDIICGLLLAREGLSGLAMRETLGLADNLGEKAFAAMLSPLLGTMVDGDESYYALTAQGRTYARSGSKYKRYEEPFKVIVDMHDSRNPKGHTHHAAIGKTLTVKPGDGINITNMEASLRKYFEPISTLLPYVEAQDPKMHLPEKGFYLEEAQLTQICFETCKLWVGVLEDVEAQDNHYVVLLPEGLKPLPDLTAILNAPNKKELRLWVTKAVADQYPQELVQAAKTEAQIVEEQWLLDQAKTLAALPKAEKVAAVAAALDTRKSFSTYEFEDEIERLCQTCKGELWMISPWIRPAAFDKRWRQIERVLKNGAKVFLGYSAPHERDKEMIAPALQQKLADLQRRNPNLFVAELPTFHEKIMFADLGNGQRYEYTGSFNVLSFAVGSQDQIGRENMRRLQWGEDSERNYAYQRAAFEAYHVAELNLHLDDLPKDISSVRAEIAKTETQLTQIQARFLAFFAYLGGKPQTHFDARIAALWQQIHAAKRICLLGELAQAHAQLGTQRTLSPAAKEEEAKKIADRIQTIGLQVADVQAEWNGLEALRETKAQLHEIEALTQKLTMQRTEMIASEKAAYEKEIARIKTAYLKAHVAENQPPIENFETLLQERTAKGLKIVGKVELPNKNPTPKTQNPNKKKKRKR
jgi:hypothetical protein